MFEIGPLSGPADTHEQRRIGFEQYRAGSDPEDRRAELESITDGINIS